MGCNIRAGKEAKSLRWLALATALSGLPLAADAATVSGSYGVYAEDVDWQRTENILQTIGISSITATVDKSAASGRAPYLSRSLNPTAYTRIGSLPEASFDSTQSGYAGECGANEYSCAPGPSPAAGWFLISGLWGLGLTGRKRETV